MTSLGNIALCIVPTKKDRGRAWSTHALTMQILQIHHQLPPLSAAEHTSHWKGSGDTDELWIREMPPLLARENAHPPTSRRRVSHTEDSLHSAMLGHLHCLGRGERCLIPVPCYFARFSQIPAICTFKSIAVLLLLAHLLKKLPIRWVSLMAI